MRRKPKQVAKLFKYCWLHWFWFQLVEISSFLWVVNEPRRSCAVIQQIAREYKYWYRKTKWIPKLSSQHQSQINDWGWRLKHSQQGKKAQKRHSGEYSWTESRPAWQEKIVHLTFENFSKSNLLFAFFETRVAVEPYRIQKKSNLLPAILRYPFCHSSSSMLLSGCGRGLLARFVGGSGLWLSSVSSISFSSMGATTVWLISFSGLDFLLPLFNTCLSLVWRSWICSELLLQNPPCFWQ